MNKPVLRYSSSNPLYHLKNAADLSKELGGVDQEVKRWFLELNHADLIPILAEYKNRHGNNQYYYAAKAFPKWKSGKTAMSGTIAERLFALVPEFMPLSIKYNLIEALWYHAGPSSKKTIEVEANANIYDVIQSVTNAVTALATQWHIPASFNSRFQWLSSNDVVTYQTMLSHIERKKRNLALTILQEQLPLLRAEFLESWQDTSSYLSYVIEVGKQQVELKMHANYIYQK